MGSDEGRALAQVSDGTTTPIKPSAGKLKERGKPLPPRPEGSDGTGLRLAAWVLLVLGLFNTFLTIVSLVAGDYAASTMMAILGFFGLLPLAGGALLFPLARKQKEAHRGEMDRWLETCLLRLAARQDGRLTAAKVAEELEMGVDQSTGALDRMATRQVAELVVTDSGGLVYQFPVDSQEDREEGDEL